MIEKNHKSKHKNKISNECENKNVFHVAKMDT